MLAWSRERRRSEDDFLLVSSNLFSHAAAAQGYTASQLLR